MLINRARHLLIYLLLLSAYYVDSTPIYAKTLPFSQPLQYAGLTFEQPLLFASSTPAPRRKISMQFGKVKQRTTLVVLPPTSTPFELTRTPTLHLSPTPTIIIAPTKQPDTKSLLLSTGGLDADTLFTMSNDYRTKKGLPALQKDERSCQLAVSRAPEIGEEIANGHMHSGLKARNLPYWNSENIISYRTEEEAFNWWINDTIHREAIEGNYTYSCVACYGNNCAQEFTNYQPK